MVQPMPFFSGPVAQPFAGGPIGLPVPQQYPAAPYGAQMPQLLTPDGQRIAACLQSTGGNYMACGAAEAANEFAKCQNGVGVPGGCFGPGGEIMKHGRNAIKDVLQGPGDSNDLVGKNGFLRRTFGF